MSRNNFTSVEDDDARNAPFKSARRDARRRVEGKGRAERQLTVRSERREQPDVRKIARAVLAMAAAQAEAEAKAAAAGEPAASDGVRDAAGDSQ